MSKSAEEYNAEELAAGRLTFTQITTAIRFFQDAYGSTPLLTLDGKAGPATRAALDKASPQPDPVIIIPGFDGPLDRIPRNRAEVIQMLGDPGIHRDTVDPRWGAMNIVEKRDMPGVPHQWYFHCHRLIEPYNREGFRRAKLACPDYQIDRAASFVFRHQRHDPSRPLSYHSWGCATDIDPQWNEAKTFIAGKEPIPFSAEWKKIWPKGLPQAFVEAFESVGFAWGGRWKLFIDPQHFEFVGKSDVQV